MNITKKEIVNFLTGARKSLLEDSYTCCYKEIPDTNLCLVAGLTDEAEGLITKVIVGIKVCVSAMQTDYDLDFNFPFFKDGDCIIVESTLSSESDYAEVADYFLKELEVMSKYIIDDRTGEILGNKVVEDLRREIDDLVSAFSDKEDFEIMSTKIAEADITEEEREELKKDLEDAFYRYTELLMEEN